MLHWSRALFLGIFLTLFAPPDMWAQTPDPTPAPPPPNSAPNQYPDLDALREPGSTAKLFPQSPPDATPGAGVPNSPPRNGRRNGGVPGTQRRRSQRANDVLLNDADSDPLELRVAYRRAKTTAMAGDPGLSALLTEAANARTDVQKRALLKSYYTRLFEGVLKADPSPEMKKHVDLLAEVARQRYDPQRRTVGGEEDIVRGGGGRRGRGR